MFRGINWTNVLSKFTNDMHVPIALFVFIVTTVYVWVTGKDLGPGYVNSLYAFYGFLAGHFGLSQKWPDRPSDSGSDSGSGSGN